MAGIVSGAGGLRPGVVLGGSDEETKRRSDEGNALPLAPSRGEGGSGDLPQTRSGDESPRDLKIAARSEVTVALSGRVYCLVDATEAAVEVGDLLTTSSTPGHAMKVTDFARSQGCVLGKTMEPLEKGKKGLVLVLVGLQ